MSNEDKLLKRSELLEERFNSENATASTRMIAEWEYNQIKKELNNIKNQKEMNSYDKYAEMTEDQQWRYVEGLEVNNELDNLNHEIKSKDAERKATPVYSGFVKYFPNAIKEVAKCSQAGNDQHHPNTPLHWDKNKSKDELDSMMRHLLDHASGIELDDCGTRHLTKCAWRLMAMLERTLTDKF